MTQTPYHICVGGGIFNLSSVLFLCEAYPFLFLIFLPSTNKSLPASNSAVSYFLLERIIFLLTAPVASSWPSLLVHEVNRAEYIVSPGQTNTHTPFVFVVVLNKSLVDSNEVFFSLLFILNHTFRGKKLWSSVN